MSILIFLFTFLFPPIIVLIGIFGNIMGFIVVSRKKMEKIGPVLIFKLLFISDTIYLGI
jgi:hypothetical protein